MNKKVYCSECSYFDGNEDCFHPKNLEIVSTWEKEMRINILKPCEINKNNDCKYFLYQKKKR